MMKAYEILQSDRYRQLAEDCLQNFPKQATSIDLSQLSGIVGLGETCIEGAKVFGKGDWQERADWIMEFLAHHYHKEKDGSCYWLADGSPFTTPGLMQGNSGIIHFLLRYYAPGVLNHPFFIT